jgi:hypothetical protein
MLPFASLVAEHRELGLVVAVLLGFGFGFVLERAGFGQANKLAAQFYLHDMTVFKVMFSAILTAMLGLLLASGVGLVDLKALSETAVSETFLWPMIGGGLLLGAGFIISGYCPGTSIVAMASGNLDGLFTVVGVIAGTVIFSEGFPLYSKFYVSGAKGSFFLYQWLGVKPALLGVGVVIMALAAFFGADKVERIFTRRRQGSSDAPAPSTRPRRLAFATLAGLAALVVGTFVMPRSPRAAAPKEVRAMTQAELARRLLDEPWTLRLLDLRQSAACAARRIPGAECAPRETLAGLGLAYAPSRRDLVLLDERDLPAPPPSVLVYPGRVFALQGGFTGWQAFALAKPAPPAPGASPTELAAYRFRAALHSAMTGMKPPPPPSGGATPGAVAPRKKKGGCSG